jgi:UDP-3-O-[3-hydroxymyristoyl] glucosamine N-acyltransferase
MRIDSDLLKNFGLVIPQNITFDFLGLSNSDTKNTLSFLDDSRFISSIFTNENITGLITTENLISRISNLTSLQNKTFIISTEPRSDFYNLYNLIAKNNYLRVDSIIHPTAHIHPTAYIACHNVIIGENVIIGPNASVLEDVEIDANTIIGANTVLGCDGAEIKRTSKGLLKVFHDGKLIIGKNVDIGCGCVIDKGFKDLDTVIGDGTFVSNYCMIAHCTKIGINCMILQCIVCGSVKIEDNVRVSPGAVISNRINIGSGADIGIGSIVVKDVPSMAKLSGYYAIDHKKFLYNYVKTFGKI